jgi:crossover junction endodeoxyribonuclease RusA
VNIEAQRIGAEPLLIELSWPAKELSPNARVHHMAKHRFAKAAKTEAGWATKIVRPLRWHSDGPFNVHIRAYPPDRHVRDTDNLIASLKSHLDGIAAALEVDDSEFHAPTLEWADVSQRGKIVIRIAEAA